MKSTGNQNINTKTYWNTRYSDRESYEKETGSSRFNKVLEMLDDPINFLDIGCGVGTLTKMVKDKYSDCEVWGVDISTKAIEENSKERKDINYAYHKIGGDISFPTEYFDFAFSGETLEHLDAPMDLFTDAYKALMPGGMFVLTTPNGDSIKSEEHLWEFNQDDIEDLFFQSGFNDIQFYYLSNLEHLLVIMASGVKK